MMARAWPLALLLAVWAALAASAALPPFVLPAPGAVFLRLVLEAPLLAWHAMVTLVEILAGLAIGLSLGGIVACLMQLSPRVARLGEPVLAATQAVPVFVLAPVLTIWLGYGLGPKIAMAVLLVFFPVATALRDGMATLPEATVDLARIAGASRWQELRWLRLPHALPHLAAGLKIAVTYAPTGAVIGEWIGASQGLGFLMLRANARMDTDLMFAALVIIICLTVALRATVARLCVIFCGIEPADRAPARTLPGH